MEQAKDASGLRVGRVAEILVTHDAGRRHGSGYLVGPGTVLTAAHVVAGALRARVRFEADRPGEYSVEAQVRWLHAGVDVAVLGVPAQEASHIGTARFARVPEEDVLLRCSAAGFPRFKSRVRSDGSRFRDCEHVHATCSVLANRREGTLDLRVPRPSPAEAGTRSGSPWEGMSGAAVFSDGRIVGVVSRHHLGDGSGRLGACRVDRWAERLSADELGRLEDLLGCRLAPDALASVGEQERRATSYAAEGRLDRYLAAAERYAGTHPYDDVSFGRTPPLADVYLRRCVRKRLIEHPEDGGEAGSKGTRERLPERLLEEVSADEVFTGAEPCVVVAGAGGGKSSLLRRCLALGIEARRHGGTGGTEATGGTGAAGRPPEAAETGASSAGSAGSAGSESSKTGAGSETVAAGEASAPTRLTPLNVPVLVPAAALAGLPFAEALAAAATAELAPFGLLETLSPELFSSGPAPGARWMVLVDGLDEIADVRLRRSLLGNLAALGERGDAVPYRFVVATRPLPDQELESFRLHYVLKPFEEHDVRRLAQAWFRYLGVPDPPGAAERFRAALEEANLAELAGSPLMATMLCRLYAAGPDGTLPGSRGGVYRSYIELLDSGRDPAGLVRVRAQSRAALQGRGTGALAAVERTLDHLPALIAHVADVLHGDNRLSAIEVLEALPAAARPRAVPPREWRTFLEAALRGSGLLTAGAGRLEFWHQTLLEFLASQHAMTDARSLEAALDRVFAAATYGHGPSYLDIASLRMRRDFTVIRIPWQYLSYIAFLLDAASEAGDHEATQRIGGRLCRLLDADKGPLPACQFIVQLVRFGAVVPEEVVNAVVSTAYELLGVGPSPPLRGGRPLRPLREGQRDRRRRARRGALRRHRDLRGPRHAPPARRPGRDVGGPCPAAGGRRAGHRAVRAPRVGHLPRRSRARQTGACADRVGSARRGSVRRPGAGRRSGRRRPGDGAPGPGAAGRSARRRPVRGPLREAHARRHAPHLDGHPAGLPRGSARSRPVRPARRGHPARPRAASTAHRDAGAAPVRPRGRPVRRTGRGPRTVEADPGRRRRGLAVALPRRTRPRPGQGAVRRDRRSWCGNSVGWRFRV
ncbi:trypsin-like peptidase domain-containing protein [Streptomyces sp. NPDC052114]|uniref:trypsin-like peptidase domain-containing protein n=1 Tax=unclassified Streptomyces TaxID=2593676 RepID=UPI00342C8C0F